MKRGAVVCLVLVLMLLMSVFPTSIFSGARAVPDVAVTIVASSKTVVGQGYSLDITVTVANFGDFPETFCVIVYANTTVVGTQTVGDIFGGTSSLLNFIWNTTDFACGNYVVSAYAGPVSGETDISIDNCTCWVFVSIVGDITGQGGYPDGKVDMRDVGHVARRFRCLPEDPLWNPNADINGDNKVDMKDVEPVAENFGDNSVVHQFERVVVDDTTYARVRSVGARATTSSGNVEKNINCNKRFSAFLCYRFVRYSIAGIQPI